MASARLCQRLVRCETIGFVLVLVCLWADELLDLPHRVLGAAATPVNWRESLLESVLVLALAALVVALTRRNVARIRYLEGFLLVCAACKRVRIDQKWVPVDVFMRDRSDMHVTHGLCPDCIKAYAGGWGEMAGGPATGMP